MINMKNQNLAQKIVSKLGHKLTAPNMLDEWNGYPEHFRLSGADCSFEQLFHRNLSHWLPPPPLV